MNPRPLLADLPDKRGEADKRRDGVGSQERSTHAPHPPIYLGGLAGGAAQRARKVVHRNAVLCTGERETTQGTAQPARLPKQVLGDVHAHLSISKELRRFSRAGTDRRHCTILRGTRRSQMSAPSHRIQRNLALIAVGPANPRTRMSQGARDQIAHNYPSCFPRRDLKIGVVRQMQG
jgi:hypothetical protein